MRRLRVLFTDGLNVMRGKYLPYAGAADGSTRFAQAVFGTHLDKDLLRAPGAGIEVGIPDMEARWRAEDIREGWERDTHTVVAELHGQDGAPFPLSGRAALARAVDAWKARGLTPYVGIELEAYALVADEDGRYVPYDVPGHAVYGTGPFTDPLRFTEAIWERAHLFGFSIEAASAEYDAPQFEWTLGFGEAVAHVDDIVLFRLLAREVALEHGVLLTFAPKPIAEAGGSGLHVNVSFRDENGNALASSTAEEPNDLARGCLAGWMHHHRGLAGLVAPSTASYGRLQPASLSGYWRNWAGDHRGVTARISAQGGDKARLEHRMADGAANPYTAVAAVLQAALLGVENGYSLQERERGDALDRIEARQGTALDLKRALDDLERDDALRDAVGGSLVENHIYMKRKEWQKTRDLEGDALRDFTLFSY